jgi:alcohol dehydrogenase class IV
VNAIVLPHTMRFNAPATQATSARIAESFGQAQTTAAADVLASLLAPLRIPHRLRDIGLAQEDLDAIASAAMSDFFISRSSRRVQGTEDVRGILDAAW